jgi:hypothetical protein
MNGSEILKVRDKRNQGASGGRGALSDMRLKPGTSSMVYNKNKYIFTIYNIIELDRRSSSWLSWAKGARIRWLSVERRAINRLVLVPGIVSRRPSL